MDFKMLPSSLIITTHHDPAHSYLEVQASIIEQLALQASLTHHSFISPDLSTYYLEVDVDGLLFIESLSEHKIEFQFSEVVHDELCDFRKFTRTGKCH